MQYNINYNNQTVQDANKISVFMNTGYQAASRVHMLDNYFNQTDVSN